jgi:hypothetical protein
MCGTMNPVGNVYCDRCHARVVPLTSSQEPEQELTPIKGLSLPTIPLEEKKERPIEGERASVTDDADWMRQLRGVSEDEEAQPEVADTGEVEDWLTQLRGAGEETQIKAEKAEAEAASDWLTQLRGADVTEETRAIEAEHAQEEERFVEEAGDDWLTQFRGPDVTEEAEVREEEVGAGDEDWLTQFRGTAVPETVEPEITGEPLEPVDIPDWLHDIGPASVETRTTPGVKFPSIETPSEAVPTSDQVPDWLQEITPPEITLPAVKAVPEAAMPTEEVPDWLQEIAPEEAAPPMEEAPDWLQEIIPEEVAPPVSEATPTPVAAEVPDWLREIAPEEAAPPTGEVPDWLQEVAPEEVAPPVAEAMLTPLAAEVPDWLQEIAPEEAAPPTVEAAPEPALPMEEVPDWLQEVAPEEVAPPVSEAMPMPVAAEVPDWLREIAPEEAAPPTEGVPDWLQEIAPEEVTPPVSEAVPMPVAAEVPDWLQEIAPEEAAPPTVEATPAQEPLPQMVPSAPPPLELAIETGPAEFPGWLSELEAEVAPTPVVSAFEETAHPAPLEPEAGVADLGELARAEIPAWMQALRPRAPGTEVSEEEPLETEGLLKGLRGVLTPALTIEVPAVRESVAPEVREASLSRAQLLQSLLAQPTEIPGPEAHKRGPQITERIQRGLVMIVLIAVAALAILTSPQISRFSIPDLTQPVESPETSSRTDLQHLMGMYETIQRLNVNAEDTILVAFEYGPTEADELDSIAKPILRHLLDQLDQEAHISIVSTRPEGLAIAAGLLNGMIESSEQYTKAQYSLLNYRPGDATGVSQLLADAGTSPKLIVVLTAQPGPLRQWIEQTRASGPAPPIVAGVSAALEPAISPYLDISSGQLAGAISGLSGAAVYEKKCGLSEPDTQWRLNILAAGHLAVVGLIVIGAVLHALGGLRRRKE